MTSLQTLLRLPRGWQVLQQITSPHGVNINLRATRKSANCPECLKRSGSVHSCRRRRIQHLPCSGQTLYLTFAVRHWYCRNPPCARKIFAESLVPFAGSRQQSSEALQNLQHQLGLIAGGEAGKWAATATGIQTSAVVQASEPVQAVTPHVGIDEWAWHRGGLVGNTGCLTGSRWHLCDGRT